MGKVVGSTLCTHVPRLMLSEDKRKEYMKDKVTTFYESLTDMYEKKIKHLDFDTFFVFDTHWWTTLEYIINGHDALKGRYTSDEIPWMISDVPYDYKGNPELSKAIGEACKAKAVPCYVSRDPGLPVHYPVLTTMRYLNPEGKKKVVAISTAYTASIENDLAFGRCLMEAVKQSNSNVVVLAAGGLSHKFWELDVIRQRATADVKNIYSDTNRAWDEKVMGWLKAGQHKEVLAHAAAFRKEAQPEGNFAHYLRLAGMMGEGNWHTKGEQFGAYEAAVGTGQVNIWFDSKSSYNSGAL